MQSQALPIDWIFQPPRWRGQTVTRLIEWLRHWATRQQDRRQAQRRRIPNLAANYWDGNASAIHVVKDISTSGAFIFSDFNWLPGTIVTVTLQLRKPVLGMRSPAPLLIRTKVVRRTENGLGVQFVFLSKGERLSLVGFLKDIPEAERSR